MSVSNNSPKKGEQGVPGRERAGRHHVSEQQQPEERRTGVDATDVKEVPERDDEEGTRNVDRADVKELSERDDGMDTGCPWAKTGGLSPRQSATTVRQKDKKSRHDRCERTVVRKR
ncbi:hypothetical protein Bbelb_296900 [Branchiostoma belcheri]|nr:hypothetical protein Bbelb_296900 [Branchiostoma belcheri]